MRFSKTFRVFSTALFVTALISNLSSCDSDDEGTTVVNGTVFYVEDLSPVVGVPVELRLYDGIMSGDIDRNSNSTSFTTLTDRDGKYVFNINPEDIPGNPFFFVLTKTDTLLNVSRVRPGTIEEGSCMDFYDAPVQLQAHGHVRDIYVDHPTFLQITFDKLDAESPDFIRYTKECILNIETSAARPDTTFLEIKAYEFVKNIHTRKYSLLKENGEEIEQTIDGISWIKRDTTKITVGY